MAKNNEEKKPLTIYDKWNKDSEEKDGGLNFDDSEWDGTYLEIEDVSKKK